MARDMEPLFIYFENRSHGMELEEVIEGLRAEKGVVFVDVFPDQLFDKVVAEERTVTAVMGTMPVTSTGMRDCMDRNTRLVVVEDERFWHPNVRTMNMRDSKGNIIGHNIPRAEIPEYMKRDNVAFISDDFIMYTDASMEGKPTMEMLSIPYRGSTEWIPEGMHSILWYPCTSSSQMIHKHFGLPNRRTAAAVLALDL